MFKTHGSLTAFVLLVLAGGFWAFYSCSMGLHGLAVDGYERHYATYQEMKEAKTLDQRWLPDIIPPSSRNFWVNHIDEPLESMGTFEFKPADANAFTRQMELVASSDRQSPLYNRRLETGHEVFYYLQSDREWLFTVDATDGNCSYRMQLLEGDRQSLKKHFSPAADTPK